MDNLNLEAERKLFEAWAQPRRYNLGVCEETTRVGAEGDYYNNATAHAWEVWQASAGKHADMQVTLVQSRNGKAKLTIDYYQLPYGTTKLYASHPPAQGEPSARAEAMEEAARICEQTESYDEYSEASLAKAAKAIRAAAQAQPQQEQDK